MKTKEIIKASNLNQNIFIPILLFIASANIIYYPIVSQFNIIDEIVVLFLFILGFKSLLKNKEFSIIIIIYFLYVMYSLIMNKNVYQAVIYDAILFTKPIISFFIPFLNPFKITKKQKKIFQVLYFLGGMFCILQLPYINQLYPNTAMYYQCCIFSAIGYLFFSDLSKNNLLFAILVLTVGLASFRAKYYTEFVFILFVFLLLHSKIKLNLKWLIIILFIAGIAIYINWTKFYMYFVIGYKEELARSVFYYITPNVLVDYFPFGPGFGTFNTEAAAKYYSPLYSQYRIDEIWGLRKIDYNTNHDFLKDTFYPALSQFGVLGYILYAWFWVRRWKEGFSLDINKYKIYIIVFYIIIIQNIADNCFTGPTGIPLLMMLAILISQSKRSFRNKKMVV